VRRWASQVGSLLYLTLGSASLLYQVCFTPSPPPILLRYTPILPFTWTQQPHKNKGLTLSPSEPHQHRQYNYPVTLPPHLFSSSHPRGRINLCSFLSPFLKYEQFHSCCYQIEILYCGGNSSTPAFFPAAPTTTVGTTLAVTTDVIGPTAATTEASATFPLNLATTGNPAPITTTALINTVNTTVLVNSTTASVQNTTTATLTNETGTPLPTGETTTNRVVMNGTANATNSGTNTAHRSLIYTTNENLWARNA